MSVFFFFLNDTATTEIYPLSLHAPLPISHARTRRSTGPDPGRHPSIGRGHRTRRRNPSERPSRRRRGRRRRARRSEEHTSELQSRQYLVCRLLLEKKKKNRKPIVQMITLQ